MPSTTLPGSSGVIAGAGASTSPPNVLFAWSVTESTGSAAAKIRFRDGPTVAGAIIATVTLAANEHASDNFSPRGRSLATTSIYFELVSGSVEGSLEWA